MPNVLDPRVQRIVTLTARKFAHRRRLDEEELRQEAQLAVCYAARSFDPNYGVPFVGYVYKACYRHLAGYTASLGPVKVRGHRKEVPLVQGVLFEEERAIAPGPGPELAMADAEWRAQVRLKLSEHLACFQGKKRLAAEWMLVHGETPLRAAQMLDLPIDEVRKVMRNAKSRLRRDPVIQELWGGR